MGKTILVVDDLEIERIHLRKILEANGYRVIEAADGKQGHAKANEARPDLILMDVVMPEINGFQALRMLQRDPVTKGIPVVMVTTKDREPDRMNAEDNGARGYVVKPATEAAILEQINKLLPVTA